MSGIILCGIDVEEASEDSLGYARRGMELFEQLNCPVTSWESV